MRSLALVGSRQVLMVLVVAGGCARQEPGNLADRVARMDGVFESSRDAAGDAIEQAEDAATDRQLTDAAPPADGGADARAPLDGGLADALPPVASETCQDPVHILGPGDRATGVQQCSDGSWERFASVACDTRLGPAWWPCPGIADPESSCSEDSECNSFVNGRCAASSLWVGCSCTYRCATDVDCGPSRACLCRGVATSLGLQSPDTDASVCVSTACRVGADCESGSCGVGLISGGCSEYGIMGCRQADDTCASNADCPGEQCDNHLGESSWRCDPLPECDIP